MSLLEAESTGDGTPQGVVLALVGPADDSPKEQEAVKAIRMYNLASLINLAKWAVVQPVSVKFLFASPCVLRKNTGKCFANKPRFRGCRKAFQWSTEIQAEPCQRSQASQAGFSGAAPF